MLIMVDIGASCMDQSCIIFLLPVLFSNVSVSDLHGM
jgi:hypothetical protein